MGIRHWRKTHRCRYELVDLESCNLPLLDELVPPSRGQYSQEHTKVWTAKIALFDRFVFVTHGYNRRRSAALKNAIDFLFEEWNKKAAGFVGYVSTGGARAIEHLRQVMGEIKEIDARNDVTISLFAAFENFSVFKPAARHAQSVSAMLDQVLAWRGALQRLRM